MTLDEALELLRRVDAAAPKIQSQYVREARIPWQLIHEIRAALKRSKGHIT